MLRRLAGVAAALAVAVGLVLADGAGLFGRRPAGEREKYHDKLLLVRRVVDGDTIDVEIADPPHPTTRVRLWGVDTPETKKPHAPVGHFGPEATEATTRLCGGKTVRLTLEPGGASRDRYGRLLAWVWLPDGRLLNRVLVEDGYGYADPRYGHHLKAEFARLQREALAARRGLWAGATDRDLPYYYRGKLKLPAP